MSIKYIAAAIPVLASAANAQVLGTQWIESSADLQPTADADGLFTLLQATQTQTWETEPTPTQATSWGYTDEVPYWHMTDGGYTELECGYGYAKDAWGYCTQEEWYTDGGCYETTIINKQEKCHPMVVEVTEDVTVWVTQQEPEFTTVTKTLTMLATEIQTNDVIQTVTQTDVMTTVRIWTSTEVNDKTSTVLHTLTATETYTSEATRVRTSTALETETKVEKTVIVDTTRVVETVMEPTTYTSIWLTTEVVNETETRVQRKTSTVIDEELVTRTVDRTETITETDTARETDVVETTVIEENTTTEVQNETQTTERVVETTVENTRVEEVTTTSLATTTQTRSVLPTELMDCLGSCKSHYKLTPSWPEGKQNQHVADPKPAHDY